MQSVSVAAYSIMSIMHQEYLVCHSLLVHWPVIHILQELAMVLLCVYEL